MKELDGDGDLDAWVVNGDNAPSAADKVWLNVGSGTFTNNGQNLANDPSSDVALGDLDADGDLDAFAVGLARDRVWLNNGSGTFGGNGQNLGIVN